MIKTAVIFLVLCTMVLSSAQEFPTIPEPERIRRLQPPTGRVRVVLDTDTFNEIDDQFALVYAILSKESMNLKAVYAAPFKNSRAAAPEEGMLKSYEEILRILNLLEIQADGFAFKGSTAFLQDVNQPHRSPAALDLIEQVLAMPKDELLYVVAVGAITNVASAILSQPEIIKRMVVVWLGGHAHSWPRTWDFNLRQDITAANVVFDSGVPLVQLPCRGVASHLLTVPTEIDQYVKPHGKVGAYLDEIFDGYFQNRTKLRSKVLWDMAAIAFVVNAEMTPSYLTHSPRVSQFKTYSFNPRRHQIRYVYEIKRDDIFNDFFDKLAEYSSTR